MLEQQLRDGILVLRLDAPRKNALTLPLLEALGEAVRRAVSDSAVRGVVITGGAEHFSAGADVGLFAQIRSDRDAVELSRTFQRVFQVLEDSGKPVAAALAGTVVGGALELALACHYRIAAAGSRFRMPEVNLGINPGAGGTQRLPRLVGVRIALRMLLDAETLTAEQALAAGLVDAVCQPGQLEDEACRFLREGRSQRRTLALLDRIADVAANNEAFQEARQRLRGLRPELVAPLRILELVQQGVEGSPRAGLDAEGSAFADCMRTPAARNRIALFLATSAAGRLPELAGVEPLPVARAAVVGLGSMGTGIAQTLAQSGLAVQVLDEQPAAVDRGLRRIRQSLDKRIAQGRLDAALAAGILASVTPARGWDELAGADLVIEAVFEDAAVKRAVFARLEDALPPAAVIATNTSTISLDQLAAGLRDPGRLVGLHFFNPAPRMPLVEVICGRATRPEVQATALQLARRLGKTAVVSRNREGFLVNRVFIPYLQEAFWLLEEGAEPAEIDAAAVEFGFPMGPLVLIDMAGLDILVRAQQVLAAAFPHHGPLSPVAARLVERGCVGQKSGAGVYRYEPGDPTPRFHGGTGEIVAAVRRESGRVPRSIDRDEIRERLVLRMVNEAFCLLDEQVARCPADLDVATVLGVGFPDFRGGVVCYAKALGPDYVVARLEVLQAQCGQRYAPSRHLQQVTRSVSEDPP